MKQIKDYDKEYILEYFKEFGLVFWYISKNNSVYFKFKDARLGSLRIADHKSRDNYSYKYELLSGKYGQDDLKNIKNRINKSISIIEDFDKDAFIAYEKDNFPNIKRFKSMNAWRNYIKKRKNTTVLL